MSKWRIGEITNPLEDQWSVYGHNEPPIVCDSPEQATRITAMLNEREQLAAFADEVLASHTASLDGDEIEEIGIKHGLLVKVTATEPCTEGCICAEFGFPAECYRRAALAASEPSMPAKD